MVGKGRGQPRTLVIVNLASAGGRTRRRWPALRSALDAAKIGYDSHLTAAPDDATAATRSALAAGYQRIVCCGGDGTLNEVLNGFVPQDGACPNAEAVIGLLPSGTGDDFRRTVGLPTDPRALAAVLATNHTRRIDVGRITYDNPATPPRHFINVADCGVGGEVVAQVNRSGSKAGGIRGTAVFLGISLRTLTTYGSRPVRLHLDGRPMVLEAQNVVVANGRCFGGGMRIAPAAELDDGWFDVVVLPSLGRFRTLMAVPSVYRGAHLRHPGVLVSRAKQVRIEPLDSRPLLFDVEGEQIGAAPATLTCLPGAVRFCVPPSGPA
ncbi:MAG TPA: diacylglycerol kinase family protein [Candidatus Dormibacteraeota bacterium]|nr:diacylglycerol kinase family protein [Candidatus Dormibacteraeota bacterium]